MHDALTALVHRDRPVDRQLWRSFWDQLHHGGLRRGETVALLASLTTLLPDHDSLTALLDSLDERRAPAAAHLPGTVNIVGTGGGPRTFNISTAAAFVAAAMGVRVVKTGSRAYSGTCGSHDLLELLGIGLTASYEQTAELVDRHGIAFAGNFVYPAEIALLARSIVPLDLRSLGRGINTLGPFLAAMPVSAQLTGVSEPSRLPSLRHLAARVARTTGRSVWLGTNGPGSDELLSVAENVVHSYGPAGEGEIRLSPTALGLRGGTLAELRPAAPGGSVADHFLDVLAGQAGPAPTGTVCLNAAALAVAGGLTRHWDGALAAARTAVRDGSALALVQRLRAGVPARTAAATHG